MTIYVIMLICILNQAAFGGSRVAVSLYALELGADQITIGALVALYSLCPMLLSIVIGKYADRVAPRVPMIIGAAGIGLTLLLPPLFQGLAVLHVMAFVFGLFHQLFLIPLEASVGGVGGVEHRARNYAMIGMGHAAGNVLGPLAAGFSIDHIGNVQVFFVLAIFSVAPVLMLWLKPALLPRLTRHAGAAKHGSVLELWRVPHLRSIFIASGIIGSAQDLFQFYLPIYGHSIGLSASAIGSILSATAIATFVIRGVVPWLIKKLSEAEILTYSVFVAAFSFILMPFFVNPYALGVIAFVVGLACGGAQPMAMSLIYVLTPHGRVAEATGLRKTVNNTTHLAVPLIFGSVGTTFGVMAVFFSNAVILVAGGILMYKTRVPVSDVRSQ